MSFSNLGLSDKVLAAVAATGYTTPTPIQEQAIPHVLARRDVLGIAQTGTGKTAAFVLPMLTLLEKGRARARMPRTLILEPTRELAAQVKETVRQIRRRPEAQRRPADRRRLVRRPGHQADARRRRADRDPRPPARPHRARRPAAHRRRTAGHRRSRPHAGHGLHSRHRTHLQAGPVHPADAVLHRDDADGNPPHHRNLPAQSREDRSLQARHHRRSACPQFQVTRRPRAAREARHPAPPAARRQGSARTRSSSAIASAKWRCFTNRCRSTASASAPCTATWTSRPAPRRSISSARAKSRCWSPPTSPPAASIFPPSATSSISTCRIMPTTTCIASAAPAAPDAPAPRSRWSPRSTRNRMVAIEKLIGQSIPHVEGICGCRADPTGAATPAAPRDRTPAPVARTPGASEGPSEGSREGSRQRRARAARDGAQEAPQAEPRTRTPARRWRPSRRPEAPGSRALSSRRHGAAALAHAVDRPCRAPQPARSRLRACRSLASSGVPAAAGPRQGLKSVKPD